MTPAFFVARDPHRFGSRFVSRLLGMPSRAIAPIAGAALLLGAIVAIAAGFAIGGAANVPQLVDPGAFVRYGVPISDLLTDLATAATIGPLVLVCFAVPRGTAAFERLLRFAGVGATIWTLAGVLAALLAFADAIGTPLRLDATFGAGLWQYLSDTDAGIARLTGIALSAVVAIIIAFASGPWLLAGAVAVAAASVVAVSQLGHQGGTADHNIAWAGLFLHEAFASVWLGGLFGIVLARGEPTVRAIVERFSSIAFVSFLVVASSGVVSGWIRINGFADLLTPYGAMLIVKAAAVVGLGVIGVVHRRWAIRRLSIPGTGVRSAAATAGNGLRWNGGRAFWGIVVGELALMGVAFGMGAALASTATPASQIPLDTSPATLLTGAPLPAPPDAAAYAFGFSPDPIWL